MNTARHWNPASLWRRLAALLYDTLLLFGLLFVATALLLPLTDGEAITAGVWWYRAYLLTVITVFYTWCWTHGGQTLGMKAWKIRVQQPDGGSLSWRRALLRLVMAVVAWLPAGAGVWWMLIDRDQISWHDRLSDSRVVRLPHNDTS